MATTGSDVATQQGSAPAPTPSRGRRPFLIFGGVVLVAIAALAIWSLATAGHESTDDAQVWSDLVPVGTRVAGQVVRVKVSDNQRVRKGDVLVELDEADFGARLKQSQAELAIANAQAAAADAQVAVVEASSR